MTSLVDKYRKAVNDNPYFAEKCMEKATASDLWADKIAAFAGSWWFLTAFFTFIMAWMALNVWVFIAAPDPYPFILLNLILSCLAAIQAPIVMISHTRMTDIDRQRDEEMFKKVIKLEIMVDELITQKQKPEWNKLN